MTIERTQNWVDGIAHRLIHRAARRAPDSLAERLEEEWLADLAEQHGQLSRLRFGLGCCWATHVIAREQGVAKVCFDRGGYLYHGRVKALADGARAGGLNF